MICPYCGKQALKHPVCPYCGKETHIAERSNVQPSDLSFLVCAATKKSLTDNGLKPLVLSVLLCSFVICIATVLVSWFVLGIRIEHLNERLTVLEQSQTSFIGTGDTPTEDVIPVETSVPEMKIIPEKGVNPTEESTVSSCGSDSANPSPAQEISLQDNILTGYPENLPGA